MKRCNCNRLYGVEEFLALDLPNNRVEFTYWKGDLTGIRYRNCASCGSTITIDVVVADIPVHANVIVYLDAEG